jgi:hypothetical protein
VGFTFFGPRGGAYSSAATSTFVGQGSFSIMVSIYLFVISIIGLILLMACLSETWLGANGHYRVAWGTSLLAAASFVVGWGLYFAPSVSLISGGPPIDPAISYTFFSAGLIVLFGVGGVLLGIALLTLALGGQDAPVWARAFSALTGLAAIVTWAFLLLSHWSPNQWLPVPFYVVVLWGLVLGGWLLVSSPGLGGRTKTAP